MENGREIQERREQVRRPACCIAEHEDRISLSLEMPGVAKENLTISVEDNLLKISGKRTIGEPDGTFLLRERAHGDFYSEYTLDETIDRAKIDASLKNGLVTVVLERKEAEKPRKIQIRAT